MAPAEVKNIASDWLSEERGQRSECIGGRSERGNGLCEKRDRQLCFGNPYDQTCSLWVTE